jgi:hypothetical protein
LFVEDGRASIGPHELEARFARDDDDPEHSVTIVAPVEVRDQRVWSRWEVSGARQPTATRAVIAHFDAGALFEVRSVSAPSEPAASGWRRIWDAIAANPLAALGLVGSATYASLRIPTGVFYARLGTTPDDVGLGPEVLLPQSLILLVLLTLSFGVTGRFIDDKRVWLAVVSAMLITVVWIATFRALAYVVVLLGPPPTDGALFAVALYMCVVATIASAFAPLLLPSARLTSAELKAERAGRKDRWQFRREVLVQRVILFIGVTFLVLTGAALLGSRYVVNGGGGAQARLFPWRAVPAEVSWRSRARPSHFTNHCAALRFLGANNNQAVVYDTRSDRAFRIPFTQGAVATVPGCLWVRVSSRVQNKRCRDTKCSWAVALDVSASHQDARWRGAAYVRRCPERRCRYIWKKMIDSDGLLRLRKGHYLLKIKATTADQSAEQVMGVTVG